MTRAANRVLQFAIAAALLTLAVRAVLYLASPHLPFGFYYDLAWNGMLLDYIPRVLHSGRDAVDLLGWSSWYDQPTFYLNTMGTYVLLTPLALLLRDGWFTVKVAQVLQFAIAIAGTAYAYRVMARGKSIWGALAGMLYALAPIVAISVRHDLDMGWAMALLPPALGLSVALVRRTGPAALPAAGALIGIASFCFHIEYGVFVGIPGYALVVAFALRGGATLRSAALALLGFVVLCAIPAYTVLTTLGYQGLYSDWAGRVGELDSGAKLALFSESVAGFVGYTLQEFVIDPNPLFNASPSLFLAMIGGGIVWCGTIGCAVFYFRDKPRLWQSVALSGGVLLIACLALGANGPFLAFYEAVKHVPLLNSLRTPDRFIALPVLAGCLAAAAFGERFSSMPRRSLAIATLAAVTLACWTAFDLREHVLSTQSANEFEPSLREVSQRVASIGPRTYSAAFVRGGTVFDTPAYGVPTPSTRSGLDILGRYIATPSAGLGFLARAGVRSIVTSPDWLSEQSNAPINVAARVEDSGLARQVWSADSGVAIYGLNGALPALRSASVVCISGGPGLADFAAALPQYRDAAFVNAPPQCDGGLSLNPDSRNSAAFRAIDAWPGARIFSYLPMRGDSDYAYAVDRFYLNDRWYRDSVDGDRLIFSKGAVPVGTVPFSTALHPKIPADGRYTFALHMAVHAVTQITVSADDGVKRRIAVAPEYGLRWFDFDLGVLRKGPHAITVSVEPLSLDDSSTIFAGDIVDGAAVLPARTFQGETGRGGVLWPLRSISNAPIELPQVHHLFSAANRWTRAAGIWTMRVPWRAASGKYYLSVLGRVRGGKVWISARPASRSECCAIAAEAEPPATTAAPAAKTAVPIVAGDVEMKRGGEILLTVGSSAGPATMPDVKVTDVQAIPLSHALLHFIDSSHADVSVIDEKIGPRALSYVSSNGVAVRGGQLVGSAGAHLAGTIPLTSQNGVLSVNIESSGGAGGVLRAQCGSRSVSALVMDETTSVVVPLEGASSCAVSVRWRKGDFQLSKLTARQGIPATTNVNGRIWLQNGDYRFSVLATPVRKAAVERIAVDGRDATGSNLSLKTGWHHLSVRGAGPDAYALMALPVGMPALEARSAISVQRKSAAAFEIDVARRSTVELAELSDGQWWAQDSSGRRIAGKRCDVFNTCFEALEPGRYSVYHAWPFGLRAGSAVSLAAIVLPFAGIVLLAAIRRRSDSAAAESLSEAVI